MFSLELSVSDKLTLSWSLCRFSWYSCAETPDELKWSIVDKEFQPCSVRDNGEFIFMLLNPPFRIHHLGSIFTRKLFRINAIVMECKVKIYLYFNFYRAKLNKTLIKVKNCVQKVEIWVNPHTKTWLLRQPQKSWITVFPKMY